MVLKDGLRNTACSAVKRDLQANQHLARSLVT